MLTVTDRDLLFIEPTLFTAASAAGHVLLQSADGVIAGTALQSAAANFVAAGVTEHHVIIVDGHPLEIISRVQATELEVSLPRGADLASPVGPGDGTGLSASIITFGRLVDRTIQDVR